MSCNLCPRHCNADRENGERGYCGESAEVMAGRAALYAWEEPCISGRRGSGAVFFSGCPLHCVYCQNYRISAGRDAGVKVSTNGLAAAFLGLMKQGANNINLVTATQFVPQVAEAAGKAVSQGLTIPFVYNTSSYESVGTIEELSGLVTCYLPDFKYVSEETARAYSGAPDYPKTAFEAITQMVKQAGPCEFFCEEEAEKCGVEPGILKKGVIVRHLLLPGHVKEACQGVKLLYDAFGDDIYFSLMNQYTPIQGLKLPEELSRRVTKREYERFLDFVLDLGVTRAFIQEGPTQKESFIPDWNGEGLGTSL
ncbi:MAG: radical SAM protein [Lachnospiraceae bacterium]|nr:radical SAM protein [Lachnospiraceae bacterium]MCH4030352.1 radical SAM protein [Lachnospiraceae bacterium]MCH4069564.1 radical SAM protein [Lachnospiraceae bacterium]MCH4107500.1 radical SAM protein [Lachnospiraceae bacterium]MCI1301649.1 radical SAM protein [Lachnospiraceae bacterium]